MLPGRAGCSKSYAGVEEFGESVARPPRTASSPSCPSTTVRTECDVLELALQSGLSCNSIHSAMSDGAAQPGCQKERCDARLKGKYFRDSNSRPQHVLLARKHCLYSGFDNFNAIVIFIMIYIVYIMILEVH